MTFGKKITEKINVKYKKNKITHSWIFEIFNVDSILIVHSLFEILIQ